ncbi:hypothetical protein [Natronorubrum sp. DTA28]|uniref:hypothetical protein n=1 Tax=Natronorubrum sp. DTA28 TaxID=3447019 RepID=UPI003F82F150
MHEFPALVSTSTLTTVLVLVAFGVLSLAYIVISFERLHALHATDESSATVSDVNCPSCGARTADDGVCDYCEAPLTDESADSDDDWADETGWS